MIGFFVVIFIGVIFFAVNFFFSDEKTFLSENAIRVKIGNKNLSIKVLLDKEFSYFQALNPEEKDKFILRLISFMSKIEFIPQDGIVLTTERIILISATFVQLTFGLEKKILNHFSTIYVYPKAYINEETLHFQKGETSFKGHISISWEDFEKGIVIPNDAINLGLHEMTHALYLETIMERYDDPSLFRSMMAVYTLSKDEVNNPWKQCALFRKYAFTSPQEYMAVAVEHFFEVPELLVQAHPTLYKDLALMLNQNPMRHVMANSEIEPSGA